MLNEENIKGYLWILLCIYGPHILVSAGESVAKNWGMFTQNPEMALSLVWKATWTIVSTFGWLHHGLVLLIVLVVFCFTKRK